MAAIGVALWKYGMRYAPHTPTYFNRDRFVLSNGEDLSQQRKIESADNNQGTHAYFSTPFCTSQATKP